MSNSTPTQPDGDEELREQIRASVADGLANHSGEFINPWIMSKSYSHEELQAMLEDIMNSKRLFNNLLALITAKKREWLIEELYGLITPIYRPADDKNWGQDDTYVLNMRGTDILGRIRELEKENHDVSE